MLRREKLAEQGRGEVLCCQSLALQAEHRTGPLCAMSCSGDPPSFLGFAACCAGGKQGPNGSDETDAACQQHRLAFLCIAEVVMCWQRQADAQEGKLSISATATYPMSCNTGACPVWSACMCSSRLTLGSKRDHKHMYRASAFRNKGNGLINETCVTWAAGAGGLLTYPQPSYQCTHIPLSLLPFQSFILLARCVHRLSPFLLTHTHYIYIYKYIIYINTDI